MIAACGGVPGGQMVTQRLSGSSIDQLETKLADVEGERSAIVADDEGDMG